MEDSVSLTDVFILMIFEGYNYIGLFISNRMIPSQIAEYIEANSVRFLSIEALQECVGDSHNYCYACFNGEYPIKVPSISQIPEGEIQ